MKPRPPAYDKAGNRSGEQIDDIPNQGTVNNLNQLLSVNSAGPTRFAGWMSETGLVTVAGLRATMTTVTNFVASVPLVLGSNVVNVIAWDSQTNLATNRYGVVITNGLPTTLTYDANGNLTNQYTSTYTNSYDWDGEDRLVRITRRSTADPIEYKTEFLYDGLGRRVQIIERTNGVVASSPRYLWCGTQLCQRRGSGGGTPDRFYVDYGEYHNPGLYHYTFDHLGSVREVHGGLQGLRARFDYDPYGRQSVLFQDTDIAFGYTGHFYHGGSGLHLAMFRALDSGMGRWLSRDPIQERGSVNLYEYVRRNPINAVDPNGLEIQYANHRVAGPYYHSKIIITPDNQSYWQNHARFGELFVNRHPDGRVFLTLGAGPDDGGWLDSSPNRPSDVDKVPCHSRKLTLPSSFKSEDEAIERLLTMDDHFGTYANILYTLIPEPGRPQYNSNSYIYSLLDHAGFDVNFPTRANTPGWRNLIPRREFGLSDFLP